MTTAFPTTLTKSELCQIAFLMGVAYSHLDDEERKVAILLIAKINKIREEMEP